MKKLLFLSFLCIAISVDLEYESYLGPAYNAKHSKYYTYLPCTEAYVAKSSGWLDDDKNADVPNGVSDCVDRLLWDESKKIYYDHCCYVRFQIDGEMHAGCIGLSEENYLDTSITIKRMEEGDIQTTESKPDDKNKKLPPIPTNFFFCITAFCDLMASTINTFGLTYLTTSMYQMMRGLELFFVCLWSKLFLKNPIYRHALLGIGTLIVGLSLVGVNSYIFRGENAQVAKNPLVGIALMSTSQLFSSTEYVIQEKFIKHFEVHPFQLVGFEGLWGSCMYSILLIIFQFADCGGWDQDIREGICFFYNETYTVTYANGNYTHANKTISKIEDSDFAFKQMDDNRNLMTVYINIVGINLTKLVSSTARAVVDTVRTVFIWLFFLLFEPVPGVHEHFYVLQLIGFILLVAGTLIYNEIVTIPYFGLDYYTRDNIAKREKENKNKEVAQPDERERLYLSVDGKDSNANSDNPDTQNANPPS